MTPLLKMVEKGDAVGVIAPAGPVTAREISPALRIIEEEGYRVIKGRHLYDKKGYLAGKDEDRLEDLHDMFINHEVKAVLCARGGYGTARLLNRVDYDLIKRHPKPLAGYSDISALILSIYNMSGINAWHGPMLRGITGREKNLRALLRRLSTDGEMDIRLLKKNVLREGFARGRIIGGNLSMICALIGTPFLPSLEGSILFIEDRGEPLYRIDRMLTQLRLSGLLNGVKGLISGSFQGCGGHSRINALLLEALSNDIPVYRGFPAGHGSRNVPLPVGAVAEMDTGSLVFRVDGFAVKG